MRLVIKTGSAILSKKKGGLDRAAVERIANQAAAAQKKGHAVVLVSSGAIAAGVARLGWSERPTQLSMKQAAAAVGQLALMEAYERAFSKHRIIPAQILLTKEDLINRDRSANIRTTLLHLLSLKTIPIINENDSVSTAEIQVGDNDTLSAAVAKKIGANKLILLSDIPGVFEQDAHGHLTTRIIPVIRRITPAMITKASRARGSKMSVGGIVTKYVAAKAATAAGIETWIAPGYVANTVGEILSGKSRVGTRFLPKKK
jgi:glutamate 5-kinase